MSLLRSVATRVRPALLSAVPVRSLRMSAVAGQIKVEFKGVEQSTVADITVNVTFVNHLGERTRLPGRVGQSLAEVAIEHKYDYVDGACGGGGSPAFEFHDEGKWFEPKYGEGPYCSHCHVIIPQDYAHLMPPLLEQEAERIKEYPFEEDKSATSRLGCQVRLTKEMDGMVVYVPDGPDSDIP